MFNKRSSVDELLLSMERSIVSAAVEKQTESLNKVASAIDHINAAAVAFDDAGMYKEAEYMTSLLEVFAKKKKPKAKKKPSKPAKSEKASKSKKDPATDGLTSEKEVENLKNKGWVFNADDGVNDAHDDDCACSDCSFADDVVEKKKNHGHDCCCPHCTGVKHSHDDDCMCSMCMDANDAIDDHFSFDDMNFAKEPHQKPKMDKEKHRPSHERIVEDFDGLNDFEEEDSLGSLPKADVAKKEDFWNTDMFDMGSEFRGDNAFRPRRRF